MNLEQGLQNLKQRAKDTSWYLDFTLYEARLKENIDMERRYGSSEQVRTNRAQIIDGLNRLAYDHLDISFNDLCEREAQQHTTSIFPKGRSAAKQKQLTHLQHVESPKVFVYYAPQDQRYLEEFQHQLRYFTEKQVIDYWDNTLITLGTSQQEAIKQALKKATIIILLVSANLLSTDALLNSELLPLLITEEQRGKMVLSVILSPCLFEDTELAHFPTANASSHPLSSLNKTRREEVWAALTKSIISLLK